MNLYRAIGSIGGLTMVSRVLGFARDMISSRVLGASNANDAFNLAFLLPNIFRRLFAEGAFSAGFVPLFSRRLQAGGAQDAETFSSDILSVFMPTLLLVTIIFEIAMPGVLLLVAGDYQKVPGKLDLAIELTRWTFPYLLFISLVALLSGVLNSLTRFAVAAFAPALLNVALIVALLVAPPGKIETVRYMGIAVLLGGIAQFALCWVAVRRAGVKLRLGRPRMTPAVRELVVLILPAISQSIARHDDVEAADVQARAFDLAMLLTLPATLALAVAAGPIIGALYQGGEYSVESARITGNILAILVTGLPAYVLVKVLTPAFYARKDVKTPVRIAMGILAAGVVANFILIPVMGIYALATVTSASAWINFALLFGILYSRRQFRMPGWLVGRVARQLIAALAMAATLYVIKQVAGDMFFGSFIERVIGLGALVGIGGLVYFAVAWVIGGIDREALASLRRRAKRTEVE